MEIDGRSVDFKEAEGSWKLVTGNSVDGRSMFVAGEDTGGWAMLVIDATPRARFGVEVITAVSSEGAKVDGKLAVALSTLVREGRDGDAVMARISGVVTETDRVASVSIVVGRVDPSIASEKESKIPFKS